MKYTTEVIINLPRHRLVRLFDNPDNLPKWQPALTKFEHLSGEPGQEGAKSRLIYDMGGRRIEMIETITRRQLPKEFSGKYEARGVKNWVTNRFYEEGPDKTRWVAENEFKFGVVMAVMALFAPSRFREQTCDDMERFKAFAESS